MPLKLLSASLLILLGEHNLVKYLTQVESNSMFIFSSSLQNSSCIPALPNLSYVWHKLSPIAWHLPSAPVYAHEWIKNWMLCNIINYIKVDNTFIVCVVYFASSRRATTGMFQPLLYYFIYFDSLFTFICDFSQTFQCFTGGCGLEAERVVH